MKSTFSYLPRVFLLEQDFGIREMTRNGNGKKLTLTLFISQNPDVIEKSDDQSTDF